MWSLRMCILACACALAATAGIEMPYEQPPWASDQVDSSEDQYSIKTFIPDDPIPKVHTHNGDLVGVLFLFKKGKKDDDVSDETTTIPEAHPVSVIEEEEPTWVPATKLTASSLTLRAFVAGKEGWDASPLWIIRANYNGEVIPGKLAIKHRASYIPFGGKEVPVENFEVLCAPQHSLRWTRAGYEFGHLPDAAISAGINDKDEPLYIARCRYKGSTTPGKYNPKRGTASISFEGGEVFCWDYEILTVVKKLTISAPTWEEQAYTTSAPFEYIVD